MKKLSLLLSLTLIIGVAANAQDFKKFRLATGVGYAKPGGSGASGGVLFDIEPGYRINDKICVSLRYEAAVVVRGLSSDVTSYDASAAGIGSYTVNGIYYLSNNKFRPYVGAGVGMISLAAVTAGTSGAGAVAETKIGFYPRVGFDFGHFNINIDYNIIGASEYIATVGSTPLETKNSYIGIRIGGFFFGGKN
jgi:hypothetical protein